MTEGPPGQVWALSEVTTPIAPNVQSVRTIVTSFTAGCLLLFCVPYAPATPSACNPCER